MVPIWESKKMNLDIMRPFNWGRTVVLDLCLPLAFGMGFKEVYLVGCDCDYSNENQLGMRGTYFYDPTKQKGEHAVEDRPLWEQYAFGSYEVARHAFASSGVRIFNATSGGKLEVFERVALESLI